MSRAMLLEARELIAIRAATLRELKGLEGRRWARVSGEVHLQYLEMPTWIDIEDAADIENAHAAFVAIVSPHFGAIGAVNATVSYSVGGKLLVMLETNAEIVRALDPAYLRGCATC